MILVSLVSPSILAQGSPEHAIPASYKFDLQLPGEGNKFQRPARIFTDRIFHEVYVADPGNARILIFNEQGILKFEFSVSEYMGAPLDVVVSSDGYIVVLGTTRSGMRLYTFDYDGAFIGDFAADEAAVERLAATSSIAIDDRDRVFALNQSHGTVVRCSRDGKPDLEFSVDPELEADLLDEIVYGSMHFSGGYLYVPISTYGAVNRFTADGKLVSRMGIKGTLIGQLNFPVSVSVTPDGIIMVLDKHRFHVVCYDQQGKFLAEFGGKGTNAGWFYHPTWIAVDGLNQVYVGQIFNNRIQVLTIPSLVYDRKSEVKGQVGQLLNLNNLTGFESYNPDVTWRWSREDDLNAFDCVEDDILHGKNHLQIISPNNLLLLAFTESVGGIYNA